MRWIDLILYKAFCRAHIVVFNAMTADGLITSGAKESTAIIFGQILSSCIPWLTCGFLKSICIDFTFIEWPRYCGFRYHDCWWPDHDRNQGIDSHDINLILHKVFCLAHIMACLNLLATFIDSYTVECHYNVVQYSMVSQVTLYWQRKKINQHLNSQKIPHASL